jgi:enhancing lycopene biosynthesis protein 2
VTNLGCPRFARDLEVTDTGKRRLYRRGVVLQAVYRYECQEGQEHVIGRLSAEEIGVMRNVLLGEFRLLLSRSTVPPHAHCLAIHGLCLIVPSSLRAVKKWLDRTPNEAVLQTHSQDQLPAGLSG